MIKRHTARIFALLLALGLTVFLLLPAWAAPSDAVTISTAEDLHQLAKNCSLDTWSRGKTVTLTADIDLGGEEFTPIPTFGGVFLGQGHTISGLRLTAPGSAQGLFRYIQPDGVVQDLTVKGTVAPGGTRSGVGGIVGDNAGILLNCSFQGTVQGESAVGGVAGRNAVTGEITGCSAYGSVSGENATGGITGRNSGLLLNCINYAGVNLTQDESDPDLLAENAGAALEELTSSDDEAYHLLRGCSDTGGIVGWSGGVTQSCINNGGVGYPHVGYNTGGIAGRQSGYLAGCSNYGAIHGRKDIGGIVGQAEPYLVVAPGRDTLDRLQAELDALDRLIDRALNDAQSTGDGISARLEAMGGYTGDARDSSKRLLDRVVDFTDETVDTVNLLAADLTNAMDQISPALDDLSKAGGQLDRLSSQLEDALDILGETVDTGGQVADNLRAAAAELRRAHSQSDAAAAQLRQALDALWQSVFPPSGGGRPVLPGQEDLQALREGVTHAYYQLRSAGDSLKAAVSNLQNALERSEPLSGQLRDILGELQGASGSAGSIGKLLERAFDTIGDGVENLIQGGPTHFTPLGEEAREASDSLFGALSGLSGEMEGLNDSLQSGNHLLTEDLRAISRQFNIVFNLLINAMNDLHDGIDNIAQEVIQDTSDEDAAATREGKVADCQNTGIVEGDRNVGGVAGAVAVEVDLDPEGDLSDRLSFGATYETKAVIQGCVNRGSVTAKKDCAGGLAGRMDLGTALDCQSYGPVASTGGNYVGGAVGFADASIRSCWAKNILSGGSYVGGIAGWANRLRDCYAIVTIKEGSEYLGAVAGWIETNGTLSGNCFVDTGWAGVDGVSYAGRAEPVAFDVLSQIPGLPQEFTAFTLTLVAEGKTMAQIPFFYGDDLSQLSLPQVPETEGCYGAWPDFDTSGLNSDITLEAVYTPWVTLVASSGRVNKLSIALAEGRFTEDVELLVESGGIAPPKEAGKREEIWAEAWEISLLGSELGPEDIVPLRLLNPAGGDAAVWQYENGRWRQVDAVRNGQYLLLDMTGTQGVFYVQPQSGGAWMIPAAAGVVALAVFLLIAGRHHKKKRGVKASKQQKETSEVE